MGKIQELYETRVRPMVPAERLQLARMILDDLTPDAGSQKSHIRTPRLARPEQVKEFAKRIVEPNAKL